MKKIYFIFAFIVCLNGMAQFGVLDVTFGNQGKVYTDFTSDDRITDLFVLPNGKIVAGGFAFSGSNRMDFMISRYNPNGSLDTTFGTNGKTIVDYDHTTNQIMSICLLNDGKILAAGNVFYNSPIASNFLFMRFNADGTHDTTFANNGFAVSNFPTHDEIVMEVEQLPSGKIIAMGRSTVFPDAQLVLAQYHPDTMALDTSYNSTGYYFSPTGQSERAEVFNMKVLPDGKVLVAGHKFYYGNAYDYAIWKFNTDGTPDNSFGTNGRVTTDFGNTGDLGFDLVVLADGKILIAGGITIGNSTLQTALIRYNTNGTPDLSFGTNGKVFLPTTLLQNTVENHLCLRANGKLVVACNFLYAPPSHNQDFGMFFLNEDGSPDTTFGPNGDGTVTTHFAASSLPYVLVEQPDGKIIMAGFTVTPGDSVMARYKTDLALGSTNFDEANPIGIYPNPFANQINISFNFSSPETVSFSLFDNRGRSIQTNLSDTFIEALQQTISIDNLGGLSVGVYFLKVESGNYSQVYKIIKA